MCSVTQTLLSLFGARTVSPATGLLPQQRHRYGVRSGAEESQTRSAPGKRRLGNALVPVIGEDRDGRRFALGASGGRRIIGAVLQIASFMIDHGLTLEEAFHQPRIDMSGAGRVTADRTLPRPVLDALAQAFATTITPRTGYPYAFAHPAAVLREGDTNTGCTEIMSPWGDVVAEGAQPAGG